MRGGVHGSIVFAAIAIGCPTLEPYVCGTDDDCDALADGACEGDGRCSYPDEVCDSGRRYAGARDPFGSCMPVLEGTESTSTADDASASTVDPLPTTGDDPTTTSDEPVCGNGIVEDGEACDELDDIDGDGCNVDCVLSGTQLWTDSWDFEGGKDYGNALAILEDGRFAVVGFVTHASGEQDALVQLREADGAIVWNEIFGATGIDVGDGIFVDGQGGLVACGMLADPVSGLPQGFVRRYTTGGELSWERVLDDPEGSVLKGCESRGDGTFAVAGSSGTPSTGNGLVAIHDEADGSAVWTQTYAGGGVELRDVTRHPNGGVVAVGLTHEPRLAIALGYSADGELVWEPVPGLVTGLVDECFGVAHDDSSVYAVGRILFEDQPGAAWVGRYTGWEADPAWWPAANNDHSDEFHEVFVYDNGDQVFAGSRAGHDIWVARYTAEYQPQWEDAVGDAGENDKAWDVDVAPDGTLLFVGYETQIGEDANIWLARYAP